MLNYHKIVTLKDGTEVILRSLQEGDIEKSHQFFHTLSDEGRLFYRRNITSRDVIAARISETSGGNVIRIIAEKDERIIGEGTLEIPVSGWSRHVAELKIVVSEDMQGKGLATILGRELMMMAMRRGAEKIIVNLMENQASAIKVLTKLGFTREAVMKNYVKDARGFKHNLLIMSYQI